MNVLVESKNRFSVCRLVRLVFVCGAYGCRFHKQHDTVVMMRFTGYLILVWVTIAIKAVGKIGRVAFQYEKSFSCIVHYSTVNSERRLPFRKRETIVDKLGESPFT